MALKVDNKMFVLYMIIKKQEQMKIFSDKKTQIEKQKQSKAQSRSQVRVLLFSKVPTIILANYSDYKNFFLVKNAV